MRFHQLNLIKYGKFSDRTVKFPPAKQDFHLIVGPNEAGKSTLRIAILDLLFGIPRNSPMGFQHPTSELRLGASISNESGELEFHRAKAQKQTLRSPLNEILLDTALTPYLGTADRNFFDQMFGLDHTRLVDGGNSILSAENDVGQVLFQSAAGVASLGKIRDALIAEADKLWGPKKAADRAYYIAANQLEKATADLKEATIRTKVWAEANSKVETSHDAQEGERDRLKQIQGKRSLLERVRRLAPFLLALRECEKQLAEIGAVVELPIDAATTLAAAERELAVSRHLLDQRNGEVENTTGDLAKVQVDEAVIALASAITKLDELRLQYSAYDQDIERREKEVTALWREICDASAQLGWKSEPENSFAKHMPTLLVRHELDQLARDRNGVTQILRAAEQAERAKLSEIESLTKQLTELQPGEVMPALSAALASARSLGDPETAIQKQKVVRDKAKTALDSSLRALGHWSKTITDLEAMQLPSQQTISDLIQNRKSLIVDQKAALKRLGDQKAEAAKVELKISQFQALHHPTTREAVIQARSKRDISWGLSKLAK